MNCVHTTFTNVCNACYHAKYCTCNDGYMYVQCGILGTMRHCMLYMYIYMYIYMLVVVCTQVHDIVPLLRNILVPPRCVRPG